MGVEILVFHGDPYSGIQVIGYVGKDVRVIFLEILCRICIITGLVGCVSPKVTGGNSQVLSREEDKLSTQTVPFGGSLVRR